MKNKVNHTHSVLACGKASAAKSTALVFELQNDNQTLGALKNFACFQYQKDLRREHPAF